MPKSHEYLCESAYGKAMYYEPTDSRTDHSNYKH